MSKISLSTVTNGQNISNINNNFAAIADELNNKVLYRTNPAGEPNQMANSLDMNGNDILNAGHVSVTGITVDGVDLSQQMASVEGSISQAQAAAASASQSATAAQVAVSSVQSLVPTINGSAQKANNLSDLPSPTTARTNLGLGSVDNTSDVNKPVSTAQANAIALKANLNAAVPTGVWAFALRPTFNGATPYDSGNLTIANYAPLASPSFTGSVQLNGTGSLPIKKMSVSSAGAFQVLNNAGTGILTLDDVGNFAVGGSINPSSTIGILGTSTNDNANVGAWGEFRTANTTGVALTNITAANVISLNLPAGDWDVSGVVTFSPAGSTTVSTLAAGINTAIAFSTGPNGQFNTLTLPFSTGQTQQIPTPMSRLSLSTSTTVYLVGYSGFAVSTMAANGYIRARRVR